MLKDLPFGIEVEMTGITREQAAKALGNLWNTTPRYGGGTYSAWEVSDTVEAHERREYPYGKMA